MDQRSLPNFAADVDIALVLSGGNALGAYHAGAYQALHERGMELDWVAAASAGAINGALICGNRREHRLDRLHQFWQPGVAEPEASASLETARRTAAASLTLAVGQPSIFVPRHLPGPHWFEPAGDGPSAFDTSPLRRTLERLVDFNLLNRGAPRFSATAVDLESGEDVVMDTHAAPMGPDHVLASSALMPLFPPVEVAGRLLGDAGMSANLPLDVVLGEERTRPLLCLAIDLLPLAGARPRTVGDATCRSQDLMFATQSRRALASWQAIFEGRGKHETPPAITVIHQAYADQGREVSGKALDFSPATIRDRWDAGFRDTTGVLDALASAQLPLGEPGLHVYKPDGERSLAAVRHRMEPQPVSPAARRFT